LEEMRCLLSSKELEHVARDNSSITLDTIAELPRLPSRPV